MTTALTERPQTAPTVPDLTTIDAQAYVSHVFAASRADLVSAQTASMGVTYDITTTTGMEVAKNQRATFRNIRVGVEKLRTKYKAPLLEIGRILDADAKAITAQIQPLEDRFDTDIKAEEARKEAIKAEQARIEAARVASIRAKIEDIRRIPLGLQTAPSIEIRGAQSDLAERDITLDDFAELTGEAEQARRETVAALGELADQRNAHEVEQARLRAEAEAERKRREEEAAQLAAERAELERQRQEQEAQARAERERIAAEERERQARIAEEARQAREEAERRAEEMRRQQAEIDRQRAELEAQQAALTPKVELEPVAPQVTADPVAVDTQEEARDTAAKIKLGDINARLAPLSISAEGLAQLGFVHVATDKAAKLYSDADYPRIVEAIVSHVRATMVAA